MTANDENGGKEGQKNGCSRRTPRFSVSLSESMCVFTFLFQAKPYPFWTSDLNLCAWRSANGLTLYRSLFPTCFRLMI